MGKPNKGNGARTKFRTFLKRLVWPITPMTLITVVALVITAWAWIIYFIDKPSEALVVAVTTALTVFTLTLYVVDRSLIRILSYRKLTLGEIVVGIVAFLFISFQNRTLDINFHTDKNFIVVLFDSKEKSLSDFQRSGIFSKELDVYNTHVVHLDSSLASIPNLRINEPAQWNAFSQQEGRIVIDGQSVQYILSSDNRTNPYLHRNPQPYIDSLLNLVIQEQKPAGEKD
ncbi:hypothetical protein [Prolixibacter denitrificans]|uniref:Uncharacterized protein n=1 Tax=Prolixibacter denitrificans TaxID=1541063 RepID=A0A2P8C7W8_9BACT|nr:hypothetical protein [Prolixibacter denitrificans]PSK81027.1 hypothetical protein CLV93_1114 [Prolixibacter denitrificans]GET22145.1 hypothetical protein JCM18694_23910 [Prolixibacter denitrificans]